MRRSTKKRQIHVCRLASLHSNRCKSIVKIYKNEKRSIYSIIHSYILYTHWVRFSSATKKKLNKNNPCLCAFIICLSSLSVCFNETNKKKKTEISKSKVVRGTDGCPQKRAVTQHKHSYSKTYMRIP